MPHVALITGDSGVGKTVSAATFPKPMLYLDYDDGFKSVLHAKDKAGNLVVPDWNLIKVENFVKKGSFTLDFITDKGDKKSALAAPKHALGAKLVIDRYNQIIDQIYAGTTPYKTLVIDSLTNLFLVWKEAILYWNSIPSLRIADYGTLEQVLKSQFIPTLKSLPIEWVILCDHIDLEKDELTGRLIEFPVGPSKPMGRLLGLNFDEVWVEVVEGDKRMWYTRPKGLFNQAKSRLNLPNPIEATYSSLMRVTKDALESMKKEEPKDAN